MGLGSVRGRKFIPSPKVEGHILGIFVLKDMFVMVLLFWPTLKMFLVKPIFSRYFRKCLVTIPFAKMTKGCIDSLLIFQIFFISRAKFLYYVIFPASVLARLCVKGTAASVTSAVLFCLSMSIT